MNELFRTDRALTGSDSLEQLVNGTETGDVIRIGEVSSRKLIRSDKILPHKKGVMLALEDEEKFFGWFINDKQVWKTAERCLPFGDTFIMRNNRGHFFFEGNSGENPFWKPKKGERVEPSTITPHPSGEIVFVSGNKLRVLRRTYKTRTTQIRSKILYDGHADEFDEFEITSDSQGQVAVVLRDGDSFRFICQAGRHVHSRCIHKESDFHDRYESWRPYGENILAATQKGLKLLDKGQIQTLIHRGLWDKYFPLPWLEAIVVVVDFHFSILRAPWRFTDVVSKRICYNGELMPHPFGILLREDREFFLLVIKLGRSDKRLLHCS